MRGGAIRVVVELARDLQSAGHRATIFTYRFNPKACYPELTGGLDIRSVVTEEEPARGVARFMRRLPIWYFWESRVLAKQIAAEEYDVLNPHDRRADRTALLAARRSRGIPVVWVLNDLRPADPFQATLRYAFRHPLVWVRDRLAVVAERRNGRRVDVIVVLSNQVGAVVEPRYPGKVRLIGAGIDSSMTRRAADGADARRALDLDRNRFLILTLALLLPERRFEDLILALSLLRAKRLCPHLVIAGDARSAPQYLQYLKRVAQREQLENQMTFMSRELSEAEVCGLYASCDAFVFPCDITWGLAPLEAMLFAKPAIVSTGAGVHEILRDGETALLAPPHDPGGLAEKLEILMTNPSLAERLGRRGQSFVRQNCSSQRHAQRMLELFSDVIAQAHAAVSPASGTEEVDKPIKGDFEAVPRGRAAQ